MSKFRRWIAAALYLWAEILEGWAWRVDAPLPRAHSMIGDLVVETLRNRTHLLASNVVQNNAILRELAKREKPL